jgi:L,D-peptidoglycan transpeptidase YkuD (ErfK/YbiS/YcfS/YnhG family)
VAVAVAAAVSVLAMASCGGASSSLRTHMAAARRPPTTTTSTPVTTTTSAPPTTVAPTATQPPAPPTTAARPAPTTSTSPPTTRPPAPAPLLVTRLAGVGASTQVIAVTAPSYGVTVATLTAYQETSAGWQQVFGPWRAHIGYDGFAPPGQKREGDGRTPSGSYGFGFFFGVLGNPGVQFPYRPVTGPNIVWDDDPSSSLYNQWVDTTTADAGAAPEPMDNTPAYDYGAVIDYNTAPVVAGAGSAIFFHVSTGGPTAGCVALPVAELLAVLRWLDPAAQPRIIMGTASTVAA